MKFSRFRASSARRGRRKRTQVGLPLGGQLLCLSDEQFARNGLVILPGRLCRVGLVSWLRSTGAQAGCRFVSYPMSGLWSAPSRAPCPRPTASTQPCNKIWHGHETTVSRPRDTTVSRPRDDSVTATRHDSVTATRRQCHGPWPLTMGPVALVGWKVRGKGPRLMAIARGMRNMTTLLLCSAVASAPLLYAPFPAPPPQPPLSLPHLLLVQSCSKRTGLVHAYTPPHTTASGHHHHDAARARSSVGPPVL